MVIKVKGLTWAPFTSGGDGAACVYGTGHAENDLIVRVDQNEERSNEKFHADDHQIDQDNSVNGATLSIEAAKINDLMKEELLGMVKGTDSLRMTVSEAPYVGIGFIYGSVHCGVKSWKAYWYYKVQFGLGQRSFQTKGETTQFQTESLEGNAVAVTLADGDDGSFFEESLELTTEAAARTWLNGRAGL